MERALAWRSLTVRLPRRRALGGFAAAAAGLTGVARAATAAPATPVGEATVIGLAPLGQIALELVGQLDQEGLGFTTYGFLTHIAALDAAVLFISDDPAARAAGDARFTYVGRANLSSRVALDPLIVVGAEGSFTVYLNEAAGASFDKPDSFEAGTVVAELTLHYRTVLNLQDDKHGTLTGSGNLTQLTAPAFTLGGQAYQFGRTGATARLTSIGEATKLDPPKPKRSITVTAGEIVTTGLGPS